MSTKFVAMLLVAVVMILGCDKRPTPEESLAKVTQATGSVVSICAITAEIYDGGRGNMLCSRLGDFSSRLEYLDKVGDRIYCGVFEVKDITHCRVSFGKVQRLTVTYMGADREGSKRLMTQEIVRGKEFYDFTVGLHEDPVIPILPRQSSDPPLLPAPIGSGAR
ncbi:MAG: hypothetical protein WC750_03785 [Patescibacteria group bacterium]|jgi:hypothetical protein